MELFFLALLILIMASALASGFPVAFALPGSAILTIGAAAAAGYLFAGNASEYFTQDGPIQWLSAGVTNFRGVYWEVERDTLIAIPLFVFMGIMLQRSKIAEDLLVTMAQLFGPIPGGLGISVVFVGALLAATTGIVGATVVAMGLISLPAMLRNNYSKALATGTIAASGTLGQIIPPSIVLIILADQLASASDQASTARKAAYKLATGEFSMPSELDVVSTSAGDMFLGAFIPGILLVGLYMVFILVVAIIRPKLAPAVHYEGKYDARFAINVVLSLVPPLALIVAVLGSILLGIATVNQAGAIGAVGATIMAGYRLKEGEKGAYIPAVLAVLSLIVIFVLLAYFDLNIKSMDTRDDYIGVTLALAAVAVFLFAVLWSGWRTIKIGDTLKGVMIDTAKTTSMVFIILLGAAMLTAAFRAFGGEELVREFLTGLPGGFWAQFFVVMAVIFVLGFFLDFIEIAVVVVPIVAPILLADPGANVTAVWLGVMIGLNIQTSFLTPPFGFALFYLRGVAPPIVKTLHMYKGVVAFIGLQLVALVIVAFLPSLVNYLPNRVYLTSETAPPPLNPRLQACIEQNLFTYYDEEGDSLRASIAAARNLDIGALPKDDQSDLNAALEKASEIFERVAAVRAAQTAIDAYLPEYKDLHLSVRAAQADIIKIKDELSDLNQTLTRISRAEEPNTQRIERIKSRIAELEAMSDTTLASIPDIWEEKHAAYVKLANEHKKQLNLYRRTSDGSYEAVAAIKIKIDQTDALVALADDMTALENLLASSSSEEAQDRLKELESRLNEIDGTSDIKSQLSKARRELRKEGTDQQEVAERLAAALQAYDGEVAWRQNAQGALLSGLSAYEGAIKHNLGLRQQSRLPDDIALDVAACRSHHNDVSLSF
ncbi:TRAP transporter large permease subunit [Limibacillus halophilus]|uniref:Tripartite ATP-independent transporter DctM subunit n=1 Tax=Limibacillus halophilus TaxID=1579333 RepID=A0A839SVJ4_9PROT|nr:TRAP transporter large permease subunit [Limibacillus halophilus]MBB3065700.1 tripartite ATP-independent transporter DctM subunit [Limibacillus halophilus]